MNEGSDRRCITVRGARVHNLRDVDVDVPLGRLVGIAGVSGSGKSSLALGVLYSEGSRRYLEALSAYTRRRISQASEASVDSMTNVPAAIALHQRPAVPGIRSTFGTMSELMNVLRLMFSRLGTYTCPNGHPVPPSPSVAMGRDIVCRTCGAEFPGMGAEDFSFNSGGACARCGGTGTVREIDDRRLVPDESVTLRDGAVTSWNQTGIQWMYAVARELGVRVDVPFRDLTDGEREIVFNGPEVQRITPIATANGKLFELNATYRNARRAVEEGLRKATSEKSLEKIDRFLTAMTCPDCEGRRINKAACSVTLDGMTLPEMCALPLSDLCTRVSGIPDGMPDDMREMAESIVSEFSRTSERLLQLGLGYLSLDRAGSTLSTGERQRVQLARSVRSRLTGAMYILDEPSIGLHPSNVEGLLGVIRDLKDGGNTVVVVDHDVHVLKACDHIIEMGPGAGTDGGHLISQGPVEHVGSDPGSMIGPFLSGDDAPVIRDRAGRDDMFAEGTIRMRTAGLHTVRPLDLSLPINRLIAVTGVSGSGKTTLVLESLVPAVSAEGSGTDLPPHVLSIECPGISRVQMIDSTPIGSNVRSTVATYCGVLDDLRRMFGSSGRSKAAGLKASDFSYNTGSLRCPGCDGTGNITMDVQFLPDVEVVCPDCRGVRYSDAARSFTIDPPCGRPVSISDLMGMTVDDAADVLEGTKAHDRLRTLSDLGLGYLALGESTPSLSGGEAQRLKLASEMGKSQKDTLFVFDEPTIGLHPLDVRVLVGVFGRLVDSGATVVVIEHDLDMIANCDYVVDMGPGGGTDGGTIVASGTPDEVAGCKDSLTGSYLSKMSIPSPGKDM